MKPIVLYDGTCGLCDRAVRTILRIDEAGQFLYAPLDGNTAPPILGRHFADGQVPDTVMLVMNRDMPDERVLVRTDALIAIAEILDGMWRAGLMLRLIPRPLRDLVYRGIARWRRRLFSPPACRVSEDLSRYRTQFLP